MLPDSIESLWHVAALDRDGASGRWRISAAADESRYARSDDATHCRRVPVGDCFEGGALAAALRCIEDNDVGIAPGRDESTVQPVDSGVVAGGGSDCLFRWQAAQRAQVGHRVNHAKRHDSAAGRRVGCDQDAVEGVP